MTDITDCNLPQKVRIGFIRVVVFFSGAAFHFLLYRFLKNGSNKTNEV
jgi:hypothetical protein